MTEKASYQNPELLLHIAQGDEAAFGIFFKQYAKLVYSYLYRYTDDANWADDLVQDIFTKLWLTREALPEVSNMTAYLFTLARRHVINTIKQRVQERKRQVLWQQSVAAGSNSREEKEVYLDLIDEAVEQLPEQQRKTWILSRRQGRKYTEIADEMNLSRETVKTYLQHANTNIQKYVLERADLGILILLCKMLS